VYDAAGRLVAVPAGRFAAASDVHWDGTTVRGERAQAGIYFYRVQTPAATFSGRFVLLP